MTDLPQDIGECVARALAEDVGSGDVTAALLAAESAARARVVSREDCVLCGSAWFDEVFRRLDPGVRVAWHARDGDRVAAGQVLCELAGPARALLTGERTALNFLQTLSGTATAARRFADAVGHTATRILDTRKTLPGLRAAQKYAVRCGGCHNHRMGLYDMVLIKENHILAAGSIGAAVAAARRLHPALPLEVEVEDLGQLDEALAAGAAIVLLDNFDLPRLREAVARAAGRARLEASGNVDLEGIAAVAETGVDYVSVGAITKHLHAVDLSMRFTPD
jgi:nicotinate-nucleotide pyrophosphorylase (carboxylating)